MVLLYDIIQCFLTALVFYCFLLHCFLSDRTPLGSKIAAGTDDASNSTSSTAYADRQLSWIERRYAHYVILVSQENECIVPLLHSGTFKICTCSYCSLFSSFFNIYFSLIRERKLEIERQRAAEKEIEECSFAPKLRSSSATPSVGASGFTPSSKYARGGSSNSNNINHNPASAGKAPSSALKSASKRGYGGAGRGGFESEGSFFESSSALLGGGRGDGHNDNGSNMYARQQQQQQQQGAGYKGSHVSWQQQQGFSEEQEDEKEEREEEEVPEFSAAHIAQTNRSISQQVEDRLARMNEKVKNFYRPEEEEEEQQAAAGVPGTGAPGSEGGYAGEDVEERGAGYGYGYEYEEEEQMDEEERREYEQYLLQLQQHERELEEGTNAAEEDYDHNAPPPPLPARIPVPVPVTVPAAAAAPTQGAVPLARPKVPLPLPAPAPGTQTRPHRPPYSQPPQEQQQLEEYDLHAHQNHAHQDQDQHRYQDKYTRDAVQSSRGAELGGEELYYPEQEQDQDNMESDEDYLNWRLQQQLVMQQQLHVENSENPPSRYQNHEGSGVLPPPQRVHQDARAARAGAGAGAGPVPIMPGAMPRVPVPVPVPVSVSVSDASTTISGSSSSSGISYRAGYAYNNGGGNTTSSGRYDQFPSPPPPPPAAAAAAAASHFTAGRRHPAGEIADADCAVAEEEEEDNPYGDFSLSQLRKATDIL
jgi:hypothetical protein